MARFGEDGQVAAVEHSQPELAGRYDQSSKLGVELWGAPGEVDDFEVGMGRHQLEDAVCCLGGHLFCALGACVDMTVMAGLVAQLPDIDLEPGHFLSRERVESVGVEMTSERVRRGNYR